MGLMNLARSMLARTMPTVDEIAATYRRGAMSASIDVWLGNTLFLTTSTTNGRVSRSELDVMLDASKLILGGTQRTPEVGDTVEIGGITYQLMLPSTGERSWRYSDPEGKIIRMHMKRV